ncbi:MAG TPA: hypothetical protein DCF33_17575 [Saprospirales bacterium]|nr:hypothetical protein [Saprospirales bacterium]
MPRKTFFQIKKVESVKNAQSIKNLISQGETELALRELQELTNTSPFQNDVALLSARFQKVQKNILLGTASEDSSKLEINQINLAILQLLDSLGSYQSEVNLSAGSGTKTLHKWIIWSVLLGVLLFFTVYLYKNNKGTSAQTYEFQYVQQGFPEQVLSKIDSLQKAGEMIRHIGLHPESQSWILLYGRNKFIHNGNLPRGLIKKLSEFKDVNDALLRGVYLGEGSNYLAWLDLNGYWYDFPENAPYQRALIDSLELYFHQNRKIRDISLSTDGSWVILWGQTGYTCHWESDSEFSLRLKDFTETRHVKVKQFFFSKDMDTEWIFLFDQNGFEAGVIDEKMRKTLIRLQMEKREILKLFMRGSTEWIILYK